MFYKRSFFGAILLYFYNSLIFLIAAFLFLLLRFNDTHINNNNVYSSESFLKDYISNISKSFSFVFKTIIVKLFVGLFVLNFTSGLILANLPSYADEKGGPAFYGYYLSFMSIGILLGAFISVYLDKFPLGKLHIIIYSFSSICLFISVLTFDITSLILFMFTWVPLGISNVILMSTAQKLIPSNHIATIYTVINSIGISSMPIGSLFGGILSSILGTKTLMVISACLFLLVALIWLTIKDLRNMPVSNEVKL